ncbi:DUF1302 domain-containing protein [Pseudomonas carassii]|uniref:DUF1302 domain-containing protein n=1 Tax=Pseudomonas carassii TaxID=3115855 RepID=A0ABU7H667_9PSED|nr:DUF1302 domain-containing protein [Pseudomonas sp. 137P]MEE1886493.1 DUF1302 domain-containing protein [Pseudomonas sp. 137P]
MKRTITKVSGLAVACMTPLAMGFTFETESIRGSFDSTISYGLGLRTESQGCNLINQGTGGHHPPAGCLAQTSGIGDQGDLNYDKGDLFTHYLKGTHELLLKLPEDFTFMARGSWIRDFAASDTSGALSFNTPSEVGNDGLTRSARDDLDFRARLLDLWVSKGFDVGDQRVRARLGNQVINWGESLFVQGGINNTNAYDLQALARPGVQLKEAVLPAPMLSLASGLGSGFNIEAYYQFAWNKSEIPPVGSYWSTSSALGSGMKTYGFDDKDARDSGQWGVSLRWQPQDTDLNLGLYVMRYHDKLPSLTTRLLDPDTFAVAQQWEYPEDRMLYGISANLPIGDWAVGTELSYRPRDAVPLNPVLDLCGNNRGKCWKDEKKFQWHLTGLYSMTPSNSPGLLELTGASTGSLLTELVVIKYPGLHDSYDGEVIAAGANTWQLDPASAPRARGDKTSSGINLDFSLTYDGTLLPGWQVTPGIFYSRSLGGRTPNLAATFTEDASSMNLYLNFVRNPASWQISVNYAKFMGGDTPYDQLLRDRDYVGFVLSRTL